MSKITMIFLLLISLCAFGAGISVEIDHPGIAFAFCFIGCMLGFYRIISSENDIYDIKPRVQKSSFWTDDD